MHVDGKQRPAAPYMDWSFRWAKAFNNKFAVKFTWQLMSAKDWEANDNDDVARTSTNSKIKPGGNRTNDPNYDGVNVYGDETSGKLDFATTATGAQNLYAAGLAAAGIPNIVPTLNAIIPTGSTYAQIQSILNATFTGPAAGAIPTINQMMPFYWGLRNNWYTDNQYVSRTGYNERDLVDYNAMNFKFTAGYIIKLLRVLKPHGILIGELVQPFIPAPTVILFVIFKWHSINLRYVIRTGLFVVTPRRKMPEKLTRQQRLDA